MTKRFGRIARSLATGAVLIGTATAQTIIKPTTQSAEFGIAPIGIGATTSELLFSQPFGLEAYQQRGIFSVTNITGAGPVRTALIGKTMSLPSTVNAENYFYISPGLPGFPAGSVYATSPADAFSNADNVYKDGGLFINGIPDAAPGHAGITFDTVGTFGNALLVSTASGVFGFNSATTMLFSYPAPEGFLLESATVAPLTNTACPGCLYITAAPIAESDGLPNASRGAIYVVKPGTLSHTAPTFVATTPGAEPENILFVTPQLCTLNGTDFAYFVSAYAAGGQIFATNSTTGALLAYTQAQVATVTGKALVVLEGEPNDPGKIYAFDPVTHGFSLFSAPAPSPATNPPGFQLEGASLVACPRVP